MIFSNININSKEVEMEWGNLHQISLGEQGRGRKEIRLACTNETHLDKGLNMSYTIGMTRSGRPRVNYQKDATLYLLISTQGGYTRRGDGWIGSWTENTCQYKVLAKGNGADGAAGRIGYWDCAVIQVEGNPESDWIRIRTSGGGYGTDPQWLNISSKGVFFFEDTESAIQYADNTGIDFPDIEDVEKTFKDLCR